jgi:NitT/TauT family transport system permease protein
MNFLNTKAFFSSIFSFLVFFLIWAAAVAISGVSAQVFPDPITVAKASWELAESGALFKHSVSSLYRVTIGFYLAAMFAIPLGIMIGRIEYLKMLLDPVIQFLRPISPLAWIPLAMLWFGIGDPPAIFLIFLSSFFPLLLGTAIAVESINPIYFQVAANFNFSRYEVVRKVIIPVIVPEVLTTIRLTIAIAWLVVVAAEMIAVQSGLGYLILDSRNALRMDFVMVGMIAIGFIGLGLDLIMQRVGRAEWTIWWKVAR